MDIKKTYSFFVVDYLKTSAIVYLIVMGITFIIFMFANLMGNHFEFNELRNLIPNYFTVFIVVFIMSIVSNRNSDLICNQFGRSRTTAFISNILVMISISIVFALIFSLLKSIFYSFDLEDYMFKKSYFTNVRFNNKQLFVGSGAKYISNFSYFLYNFAYYSFISFYASVIGLFIYSLWVRLEKIYRWIAFIFIPVLIAYSIPRLIMFQMDNSEKAIRTMNKIIHFFGLQNGFSYQYILVSILVILIPLIIISYFIMRKKPLYGKKK
ncbi:MAG: hypothetical protein ACPKM0_01610 [Pleomorphochaeta sp.]